MKFWLICVLACFGIVLAQANAHADPDTACARAAADASAAAGLPAGMLLAIGMIESGWTNPATGKRAPWPYSVNADGKGYRFADAGAAINFVRLARGAGARFIDVGCFQIDLEDHPNAFGSLAQAFDPRANAGYAAGFLNRLRGRLGSWNAAITGYHSQTASLGLPYQRLVLAAWHGGGAAILPAVAYASDPYVIMVPAAMHGIAVITPSGAERSQDSLPRIITP